MEKQVGIGKTINAQKLIAKYVEHIRSLTHKTIQFEAETHSFLHCLEGTLLN